MDPVERTINLFHESIEAKAQYGEELAPRIAAAGEKISSVLVNDGRILLCGIGNSALNAQQFSTILLNQGNRERPGLPAQLIDASTAASAIGKDYGAGEIFSRQIQAFGHPGDCLVIYTTSGTSQSLINAVQAAHERSMQVISICGGDGGHISQLLDGNDLEIRVPLGNSFRIMELHLLITFCLCDLIDEQLFGGA